VKKKRDAIAEFWAWWPSVEKAIAAGFSKKKSDGGGLSPELVRDVSSHVTAIHEELQWEFGPGRKADHHLAVTAHGDPELRVVAERWLHHAPKSSARWEFHASRQANPRPSLVMEMDDKRVPFDELLFVANVDDQRERVDLVAYHPAFAKTKKPKTNINVVFVALDNLLGEDDVERFLGAVEVVKKKPREPSISYLELKKLVAKLAKKATGEKWALLEGTTKSGKPLFGLINQALKRIDHPLLDSHVTITIRFDALDERGLPSPEDNKRLEAVEEDLLDSLGDGAANLGHETLEGRRVIHLHVMEGGPAAQLLASWQKRHRTWRIEIEHEHDPAWSALHRFD